MASGKKSKDSSRTSKESCKEYLDIDVLEAARNRISYLYQTYNNVVVSFSGGKDSSVVLYLCKEICDKRGEKVKAIFRDEEIIPDCLVDHMMKVYHYDWVDMLWFAIPLKSDIYVLGKTKEYVQWGNDHEPFRSPPPFAITRPGKVYDQHKADAYIAAHYTGSTVLVTGVRADESLVRLRSIINNNEHPWISKRQRSCIAKPIYDWCEDDVLLYTYENNIPMCDVYESQFYNQTQLRVSTPLHSEQAKRIYYLRSSDPEFYQKVLDRFPEMAAQDLWYRDIDRKAIREKYGKSLEGVKQYIYDHYEERELALERFEQVSSLHEKNPLAYPVKHILRYFVGGTLKRVPLPLSHNDQ